MFALSSPSPPRGVKILPSILSADFLRLGDDACAVMAAGGDMVHIDIMDGRFVPNLTFGPDIVRQLRPWIQAPFDVHLMTAPVDPFVELFAHAGADILTVHAEAGPHLHRTAQTIRALGKKVGVALNPATPVSALECVLDDIDLVLVMSVNPGFGGQQFLSFALDKIVRLKALIGSRNVVIEVDGGVGPDNAGPLAAAGADWLVAGSAVFKDGPQFYARNIAAIRDEADRARGRLI